MDYLRCIVCIYDYSLNLIMRKREADHKKYLATTRPLNSIHQFNEKDHSNKDRHSMSQDIHEQLRVAIEELQHHRLTSDLEIQKRVLLEQQLKTLNQQLNQQKQQTEQLRREYGRLSKKYSKTKQKRGCDKCKTTDEMSEKLQKQRQIYINDRKILQDEIKYLKLQLQNSGEMEQLDSLRKELYLSVKKIEQQARLILFMSDKLSVCEMENVQIMNNVQLLENRLSDMEIQRVMQKKQSKPYENWNTAKSKGKYQDQSVSLNLSLSKKRKNGSIQNMKRCERGNSFTDELERYES